jgi:hypothetical protein
MTEENENIVKTGSLAPEARHHVTREDILNAPDSGSALEAYQAAIKDRIGGTRPHDLMFAMGERLLQLGEVAPAMQWTLVAEQVMNTDRMTEMTREFKGGIHMFGQEISGLHESSRNMGVAGDKMERSSEMMMNVSGRMGSSAADIDGAANKMIRVTSEMQESVSRMSRAADGINQAADKMRRPGY